MIQRAGCLVGRCTLVSVSQRDRELTTYELLMVVVETPDGLGVRYELPRHGERAHVPDRHHGVGDVDVVRAHGGCAVSRAYHLLFVESDARHGSISMIRRDSISSHTP